MRMYTVYIRKFSGGKVYVGCTSKTIEQRAANGNGYSLNKPMYEAIQKYGWENVVTEILATTYDAGNAKVIEEAFIKQYDSCDPKNGYNVRQRSIGVKVTTDGRKTKSEPIAQTFFESSLSIQRYRERAGMTQLELADMLGVKQGTVSNWESGDRKPDIFMLKKISTILNCTTDELLTINNNESGN